MYSRFTDEKLRFHEVKVEKLNFSKISVPVSGRARKTTRVSDLQLFKYNVLRKNIFKNVC